MASRIPSEFVPLDVNYAHDRAIRAAGPMAELLFVRGMAYARKHKTEGLIPDYDLTVAGVGITSLPKHATSLVREGLWLVVEGGWQIRSWGKWNPVSEQERHDKQSEGGVRGNHIKWHTGPKGRPSDTCPICTPICTPIGTESGTESHPRSGRIAEVEVEREERDSSSSPFVTRGAANG